MEEWITDKRIGSQTGILFVIGLVVLDLAALAVMGSQPIGPLTFFMALLIAISLPLIGFIVYQLYCLSRSSYALDRNTLTIDWGPIRQIIPTESIQRIMLGTEVPGVQRFRGWRWPGLMSGHGEVEEAGLTLFYASTSLANQLIVVTPALAYAISPADPAGFIESIKARYELGPTQAVAQTTQRPVYFDWPLWRDRLAYVFPAISLLLLTALFAFVCFRYPDLPTRLPLHYTIDGLADRIGPASEVFILPLIGIMALTVNLGLGLLLYRRERMASYLLWGGTILVQLLLWVSTLSIVRLA